MTPAKLRKLIGKNIRVYCNHWKMEWEFVVLSVNAKRRIVNSADGAVYDYSTLDLIAGEVYDTRK